MANSPPRGMWRGGVSLLASDPKFSCALSVYGDQRISEVTPISPTDRIFEVQFNGIDLVIGIPIKWGVGYGLAPKAGCVPGAVMAARW